MSGEPRVTSQPNDEDKDLHPDLKAWRDSLPPPLSPAEQAAAVERAKEYETKNRELSERISAALSEYARMYEDDPRTWQILKFDEKLKVLKGRLEKKGIIFNESEQISLRTALRTSTVRMYVTEADVDAHDGPDNPARIADEAKKAVAKAAETAAGDSKKAK